MTPASQTPTSGFCQRVHMLIDTYDLGNVAEAARRIGVSQRGLAKVYVGKTINPRLSLIQKLVHAFPAESALWLITGAEPRDAVQFKERSTTALRKILLNAVAIVNALNNQSSRTGRRL